MKGTTSKGWLTLFLQIIIGSVTCFSYIITLFISPLHDKFGWAAATIILVFTFSMWVGTPANIIGGWLRDKLGCKKVIIFSGLFYGLGIAISGIVNNVWVFVILQGIVSPTCMFFCYIAALANIGVLFPDNRGFTTGLYVGGYSLGSAALAPIAAAFLSHFSVSFALVAEGIIYGIIVVICGLFIFDPKDAKYEEEEVVGNGDANTPQVPWQKLIRQPSYYLIMISFILIGIIGFVVMSNGAMLAEEAVGATTEFAAWAVTIINIAVGIGGFTFGFLADKTSSSNALIILAVMEAVFCALFLICGMNNVPVFIIVIIFLGLGTGGAGTLLPVITMDAFGDKFFGVNMGLVSLQTIVATFVGPQLSVRCDMQTVFLIGGLLAAIGIPALLITKKSIKKLRETWVNTHDEKEESPADLVE